MLNNPKALSAELCTGMQLIWVGVILTASSFHWVSAFWKFPDRCWVFQTQTHVLKRFLMILWPVEIPHALRNLIVKIPCYDMSVVPATRQISQLLPLTALHPPSLHLVPRKICSLQLQKAAALIIAAQRLILKVELRFRLLKTCLGPIFTGDGEYV